MKKLCAVALGLAILAPTACSRSQEATPPPDQWWSDVQRLAADDMEGRGTGTDGYRKAVDYVVERFEELGLRPAGTEGFLQPVAFENRVLDEARSGLEVVRDGNTIPIPFGSHAIMTVHGRPGTLRAPMVFAGYGLTVPEYGYDDLAGLDVKGKVVVVLQGAPVSLPSTVAAHYSWHATVAENFRQRGAVGALFILNPRLEEIPWERVAGSRTQFTNAMVLADPELTSAESLQIAAYVNPAQAGVLFAGSGIGFDQVLAADSERMPLPRGNLAGVLQATTTIEASSVSSPNVLAMFPGSDPVLADEYVLLSAHLDHVGISDPVEGDRIYNGAMDNASGVATLLEVARALSAGETRPRRSILLLACAAEEQGLLGSEHFAARPTVPMRNVAATINLDMFLPIIPMRTVRGYGVGESDLAEHLSAAARDLGIEVQDDPQPERNIFIRSDQYNFIKRGVPALFLSVGFDLDSADAETMTSWFANRYHSPSDDVQQPIDLESAAAFNRLMTALTLRIADADQRPAWNVDSFFRRFADSGQTAQSAQ